MSAEILGSRLLSEVKEESLDEVQSSFSILPSNDANFPMRSIYITNSQNITNSFYMSSEIW